MPVKKVYWDTDAFLGFLQGDPGKVELCSGTLKRADDGEVLIFTSTLTIAEVLWKRGGPKVPKEKAEIVRKFFKRSYIRVRNVTRLTAEAAQDLVWNNHIRPKDAIHVACALDAQVDAFETFDDQLLQKTGMVGNPPLVIRKPLPSPQGEFSFNV